MRERTPVSKPAQQDVGRIASGCRRGVCPCACAALAVAHVILQPFCNLLQPCLRVMHPCQVIEGLDWVREHYEAPAVVVMALGGEAQYALDMAVRALVQSGVTVVVAAGNEDTDACSKSPARCAP